MIKIVLINHTFQEERYYKRWKILADRKKDLDVYLLAPRKYEWGRNASLTYGKSRLQNGVEIEDGNFHIKLFEMEKHRYSGWTSSEMIQIIDSIQPDIIYHIGEHTQDSLMQIIDYRNKELKGAKVLAFSMRGHQHTLKFPSLEIGPVMFAKKSVLYCMKKRNVNKINRYCDAIFCHYPDAVTEFRKEGYTGPIYMQTQVGVDPDVFFPNQAAREKIRQKYQIGDAYLFGSASRFHASKGLGEIIDALPTEGNWKYLMIGWGTDDEVKRIQRRISERGLTDKVILTGYIEKWPDMAEHWSALDCAIHAPLTTPQWEETFSLSLVQAMITGLPVIGSSSGSVPYQIGPDGIIVQEKDIRAMNEKMVYMISHPDEGKKIGQNMRKRALDCFSIYHLNELFYLTICDILNNIYDEKKIDMASYCI